MGISDLSDNNKVHNRGSQFLDFHFLTTEFGPTKDFSDHIPKYSKGRFSLLSCLLMRKRGFEAQKREKVTKKGPNFIFLQMSRYRCQKSVILS
jgi:hypothetical protein